MLPTGPLEDLASDPTVRAFSPHAPKAITATPSAMARATLWSGRFPQSETALEFLLNIVRLKAKNMGQNRCCATCPGRIFRAPFVRRTFCT